MKQPQIEWNFKDAKNQAQSAQETTFHAACMEQSPALGEQLGLPAHCVTFAVLPELPTHRAIVNAQI